MTTKGVIFLHDTFLDLGWTPGPGQKYADAPKASMQVTHITATRVYYCYAGTYPAHAAWSMDRKKFEKRFPNSLA